MIVYKNSSDSSINLVPSNLATSTSEVYGSSVDSFGFPTDAIMVFLNSENIIASFRAQ